MEPMKLHTDNRLTCFAKTNWRGVEKPFGIRRSDRRSHLYSIGKTGTGKSTLLATLALQDMENGEGLCLVDPHGDLVERLLDKIPEHRKDDLIYFNVPDTTAPLGFNPLAGVAPSARPLAASGILEAMKKIWKDSWGPRLEHILRHALLATLEIPDATFADVLRLLADDKYRRRVAQRVANPQVRNYWLREYESYPARFRAESIAPVQNKVGAFLANPILRNILTQPKSAFEPRQLMDEGKILLVNLAKGKLGEDTAALLGALLVSRLGLAGLSRADTAEHERRDFYLYLDEFQTFTTLSLADMLSELRKYRVNLVLAHQYLSQLDEPVRDAVLGNVGTLVNFRLGPEDAELMEKEFAPEVSAADLMNLPNYQVYVKLMVNGSTSTPFSGKVLLPSEAPHVC